MADETERAEPEVPDPEIPPEALESVDLVLEDGFRVELMANELNEHLKSYHVVSARLRAARHQGNHREAEDSAKQQAYHRSAIAWIQYDVPGVKEVAARKRTEALSREVAARPGNEV